MTTTARYSWILWGRTDTDAASWQRWLACADRVSASLPAMNITHLGVSGEEFRSGRVMTAGRAVRRINKALANGTSIQTIEIYSLPPEFTTAIFDNKLFLLRGGNKVVLTCDDSVPQEQAWGLLDLLSPSLKMKKKEFVRHDRNTLAAVYAETRKAPRSQVFEVIESECIDKP